MELKLEAYLKFGNSGYTLPCGTLILRNNKLVKFIEHSNTGFLKSEFSEDLFPIKLNTYEVEYLHKYNYISEVHNATIKIKDDFKFYIKLSRINKFKIQWMSFVYWSKNPENLIKVIGLSVAIITLLSIILKK